MKEYQAINILEGIYEEYVRDNDKDYIERNTALTEAVKALTEIQYYRAIGTVEECREARERQKGKKPILCMNEVSGMFIDYADGHGEYKTQMNNWWRCPCCNEVVGQRVIAHKHIHDQRKKKFCEKCGQAISWESDAHDLPNSRPKTPIHGA